MHSAKMLPCLPISRSVTTLYVFSVINLLALLNFSLVDADLIVLDRYNKTIEELSDLPAAFGASIPEEGISGHLKLAQPVDACRPVKPPSGGSRNSSEKWIALIQRKGCDFGLKVLNAQTAGYFAAIIHNIDSDKLITMHGDEYAQDIEIASIFIGQTDGVWLRKLLREKEVFSVILDSRAPLNPNLYLLPFAIVVGVCFIAMVIFMAVKWALSIRRRRRSRLSHANLNKIPTKKFRKGDPYDCCAICLDDYEEGDKLRVLPCAHAYHQKCVDPWLTKNKKTCPLCKKKVIPGEPDTSSEEESDDDESGGESTPLLGSGSSSGRSRGGNTFGGASGVDGAFLNQGATTDSDDASVADFATPGPSHSHVEVHHTPRLHRGGAPDYSAVEMSTSDDELGGIGGQRSFDLIEDHFDERGQRSSPLEVHVIGNIQEDSSDDEPLV